MQTENVVRQSSDLPEATGQGWRQIRLGLQFGLVIGGVSLFVALAGLFAIFAERDYIGNVLSMSTVLLFLLIFAPSFLSARRVKQQAETPPSPAVVVTTGALAGLFVGVFMALLAVFVHSVNMRDILVNATPELVELLTLGLPLGLGVAVVIIGGLAVGAICAAVLYLPALVQRALATGLGLTLLVALLRELFRDLLRNLGLPPAQQRFMFIGNGLSFSGFLILLAIGIGWIYLSPQLRQWWGTRVVHTGGRQQSARIGGIVLGVVILLLLPYLLGLYWADVLDLIGIYVLMGLGLNIVVGYAGLLDLGYVAFFAIGAYTTGSLTSVFAQDFVVRGVVGWPFLAAWPVAIILAALAGVILGIPVLRMRGDYLAIVTLGFGEIIRVLATSDLLKPYIGGAQGILEIPKPAIFGFVLSNSQILYYLILLSVLLAVYVSIRLAPSRIGRAWMAMREDEDVAEAMGINLVSYKLLAFATGAAFAGMAGGIFASKLASIFPHSFNILWSINVLCLIIVGGLGSIPGVVVGGLILVGLPEILREFTEYRLLFYGALLVVMMLARPEGFWPARRQRVSVRTESEGQSTE